MSNAVNADANSVGSGSGSSTGSGGNASSAAARPSVPKEDHRKQNYSVGKSDSNTTSRLHRYIRGEPDAGDSKEASSAAETEASAATATAAPVLEEVPKRVVNASNAPKDESEIQEISVNTQPKKRPTRFYRRDESHYSSDEDDYDSSAGKARGLSVSTAADEKESSDAGKGDQKGESNVSPSEAVAIRKYKDTIDGTESSTRTTVDDIIKVARNAPRPLSREIESDDDDVDLSVSDFIISTICKFSFSSTSFSFFTCCIFILLLYCRRRKVTM